MLVWLFLLWFVFCAWETSKSLPPLDLKDLRSGDHIARRGAFGMKALTHHGIFVTDDEDDFITENDSRHGLFKVTSFLKMLYSESSDHSRVVFDAEAAEFRYLLLNSSNVFVVSVGGGIAADALKPEL